MVKKIPKKLEKHGDVRLDNYFWMRERDSKDVLEYLNHENSLVDEALKPTEDLQEELFSEIKSRIKEDDSSVPIKRSGYYYYTRYEKGKEYPIYCRKKKSLEAEETVFLDVNVLAKDQEFCDVKGLVLSEDQNLLAYCVDYKGRRIYDLVVLDLTTQKVIDESVLQIVPSLTWAKDNKTIFYIRQDEKTLRPYQVWRHELSKPVDTDVFIYEEKDDTYRVYVDKSPTRDFIEISSHSTLSSEYQLLDAAKPTGEFKMFLERRRDHEYHINHAGEIFYIITNKDNAMNFKIMKTSVADWNESSWEEVVPHDENIYIESLDVYKNFFVVEQKIEGLNHIAIYNRQTEEVRKIPFEDEVYVAEVIDSYEYESDIVRFAYESLVQPPAVYDIHMQSFEKELKKVQEVLGYNPHFYETHRLFVSVGDGVKVPVSIVHKKGISLDSSNPLLLYGYGSYGISIDPYFRSSIVSLLDRGFVYAIAHIRGGSELGKQWYESGKLMEKMNTFTDFIAVAKYLIAKDYTSSSKIFALGGSAGGLLMGAVMNICPELFAGVIAAVPFVDVLTTMLDDTIPLTTGEYDEWGNPNEKTAYEYIKQYSPYDNVTNQNYPHLLVTTGYHDSQVQYWEPAKWVAKLKELNPDNKNLLLLKTDMGTGHGGKSGRFEQIKEIALDYAFFLHLLTLSDGSTCQT